MNNPDETAEESEWEGAIAFTQTIVQVLPVEATYINQYKASWHGMEPILNKMGKYACFPELTLQGKIHYHGILKVTDRLEYFKGIRKLRKLFGHNLFKCIDNHEKWKQYISKDMDIMEKLLKIKLPLINHGCKDVCECISVVETAPHADKDGTLP